MAREKFIDPAVEFHGSIVVSFIPSSGTHLAGIPVWIFDCVIDEAGSFSLISFY